MSRRAVPILLADQERATLQAWVSARSRPLRVIQRAKIILLAAAGMKSQQIAQRMGASRPTVQLRREQFLALRTAGLEKGAPRPGRIPPVSDAKRAAIVEATLHSQPPHAATPDAVPVGAKCEISACLSPKANPN
ncbi:MAG: helix-turn-helix domain-containing protein [Acidobacteria bacterium]|nr:MAG: helix-turn-helix domain-containing protein [Acidobacteriota bacterium]